MSGFGRWEMIMERVTGKVHGYEDRGGNGDSFGNKCVRHYDEQLW